MDGGAVLTPGAGTALRLVRPTQFVPLDDRAVRTDWKDYTVRGLKTPCNAALDAEDMPFIYSSHRPSEANIPDDLSDVVPTVVEGNRPGAMWVLKAQWDAQQAIPNSKMVILRDLEKHPKDQHTNTAGPLKLGRIFAKA